MNNQRRGVFISSIVLNVVLVIVVAFLSYRLTQLDQEPKLYSFDLATDDLYIKNMEMVVYPDSIYVGEQYLERNGDEKSFEGISVITSYSIHYTKLYEEDRDLFRELMRELEQPVPESTIITTLEEALRFAEEIGYPLIVRPAYTRITSYNVCYTKLLR